VSTIYRAMATTIFIGVAALAAGQTGSALGSSVGPDVLSCSALPCVLQPVQASEGPKNNNDAPIVADPVNPGHLIVGNNDWNCAMDESLGFYVSLNGGSAWSQVCMSFGFVDGQQYIPAQGPIVGYDRNGVAYIGGFYIDGSGQSPFGFEGFEKSSDGMSWTAPAPAVMRQNYDPGACWMAVDTSASSPHMNSVYISCVMIGPLTNKSQNQVVVSHSNDSGATWYLVNVAPVQINPDIDRNTAMTIGKDGTVYLTWMYCNSGPQECENDKADMVFSKSGDGGNTWTAPTLAATVTLVANGIIPNTNVGVTNTPAIGVDNSNGPRAGNLYMVMYTWTGTFMQVQVVHSTDGGKSWSKPIPVAPGITHDQFFPWLSVSSAGLVGVSWLDRRNDPNNVDYQAFAGISADGGLGFEPNVQLTKAFSDPNTGGGISIGQYAGNTWDGPNYFIASWMDESNGVNTQDVVGGIRLK
jgi:hypothetical protein